MLYRTTGIKLETAAFAVFAVIPSTLLLKVPSNDNTLTNTVKVIPSIHTTVDLKNLDIFPICILSDMLEIIESTVPANIKGIITIEIRFPINAIKNNIKGCTKLADTKLPVLIIRVIRSGTNVYKKPIKLSIVVVIIDRICEKLDKIIVTINIYCTKYATLAAVLFSKFSAIVFTILTITITANIIANNLIVSKTSSPNKFKILLKIPLLSTFPVIADAKISDVSMSGNVFFVYSFASFINADILSVDFCSLIMSSITLSLISSVDLSEFISDAYVVIGKNIVCIK